MNPVGQGMKRVLAAQFYLSKRLVGLTRVISFLLFTRDLYMSGQCQIAIDLDLVPLVAPCRLL